MLVLRTGSAIDLALCGHVIRDRSRTNCHLIDHSTGWGGLTKGHVNS